MDCNIHMYIYIFFFLIKSNVLFIRRTTSANRSLPDIPKDKNKEHGNIAESVPQDIYETTETMEDHSELYATVQDTGNRLFKLSIRLNIKYFQRIKSE